MPDYCMDDDFPTIVDGGGVIQQAVMFLTIRNEICPLDVVL